MTPNDDHSSCFTCPRCENRVERHNAEVGTKVNCPTCGLELIVPRRTQAGAGQGRGEDDEYALRIEPTPPPAEAAYVPGRDFRDPRTMAEKAVKVENREQLSWQVVRHAPPLGLFFAETFVFPFSSTARAEWTLLTIGTIATVAAVKLISWLPNLMVLAGAMFVAAGLLFLFTWTIAAPVYGLFILRQTSYGCDVLEEWPTPYSTDTLGENFFVGAALIESMLPALVIAPLWDWLGWPTVLLVGLCVILLFPILLLSMLETNSLMNPVSLPVWRSVAGAWRAWGLFYSIVAAGAAFVYLTLWLLSQYGGVIGVVAAGAVLTAAWMVYFRLLGRLAWFCSGRYSASG